jgi:hypothetical protein
MLLFALERGVFVMNAWSHCRWEDHRAGVAPAVTVG